jgi:hypothetical protein
MINVMAIGHRTMMVSDRTKMLMVDAPSFSRQGDAALTTNEDNLLKDCQRAQDLCFCLNQIDQLEIESRKAILKQLCWAMVTTIMMMIIRIFWSNHPL